MLLLWVPPLLWASNIVLGRALGGSFPPVSLAVGRWTIALLVLSPFVATRAAEQRPLLYRHWKLVLACGAFGIAGYSALAYVALETTPAIDVAFANSTLPLMVPIAALALAREPVRPQTLLGIVLSFSGVAWIFSRGESNVLLARPSVSGNSSRWLESLTTPSIRFCSVASRRVSTPSFS